MAKKPVSLSKGASKKSVADEFDDEDTSEDEFEEIEEETPAMAAHDKEHETKAQPHEPTTKAPEVETDEKKILERTAAKLKADEESHQQVRDQHDKDNKKREEDAKAEAAKAAKEEQAQQAKQDAEMHKGARG